MVTGNIFIQSLHLFTESRKTDTKKFFIKNQKKKFLSSQGVDNSAVFGRKNWIGNLGLKLLNVCLGQICLFSSNIFVFFFFKLPDLYRCRVLIAVDLATLNKCSQPFSH